MCSESIFAQDDIQMSTHAGVRGLRHWPAPFKKRCVISAMAHPGAVEAPTPPRGSGGTLLKLYSAENRYYEKESRYLRKITVYGSRILVFDYFSEQGYRWIASRILSSEENYSCFRKKLNFS